MGFDLWVRFAAVSLACLACSLRLHAQGEHADASPVVTTVDPCVPVDIAHFRRLLSIELGTSIDYQPEAPREPGRTWVHLSCVRGGIALQLEDGVTHKSMLRLLDAEPIAPADRTRLVALAVAEFVVASWVELRAVPQPAVPAIGAQLTPEAKSVAAATVDRRLRAVVPELAPDGGRMAWEIAIGGGIDTYTSHGMVVPTASIRLVQSAIPLLAFVFGADLGVIEVPVIRADQRAGSIHILRASGLASLLFGGVLGNLALHAGPGIRFGAVRMASRAAVGGLLEKEFLEPHGGPIALGRLNYRLAEHFSVGLELELGAVTLPVEATVQGRPLLRLRGAWFSSGLRLSALF